MKLFQEYEVLQEKLNQVEKQIQELESDPPP